MPTNWSRRQLLKATVATAVLPVPGRLAFADEQPVRSFNLTPRQAQVQMVPEKYGKTGVWCFNGQLPGPTIRVQQDDRVSIQVNNQLDQETTVHWHGLRVPNAMDGVPHLTQKPISPGDSFQYQFVTADAGTYWYHPHQRSMEQVGRGLYGAFIIEEKQPPVVDREIVWVLDDWKLDREAQLIGEFGHPHDLSHAGRIGSTVTINGRLPENLSVQSGERIRLRLINAANARIFRLAFAGHQPQVIAIDGHPVSPHHPVDGAFTLAPAMRMDLIVDMTGKPGEQFSIVDGYYQSDFYTLADLVYSVQALRDQLPDTPIALPANPLAEPDLDQASRFKVAFEGGAMGDMEGAMVNGKWQDLRTMAHDGKFWAINGVAASGHMMEPLLTIPRGDSVVLSLYNQTRWPHPIHLHGHSFRVIARNNEPTRYSEWQDTVLIESQEKAEIAFVADNPGDWMFHCHILEHQASGMMGVIRVA